MFMHTVVYADFISYDKEEVKTVIQEISNSDPFPEKKTETRWIIDIENEFDLSDKSESNTLPIELIQLIALLSEYFLWLVLVLLLFILYINRDLLNVKQLFRKKQEKETQIHLFDKTGSDSHDIDFTKQFEHLYQNKKYRQLVSFAYKTFLNNSIEVPVVATENDVLKFHDKVNTNTHQLVLFLTSLRVKSAYRHIELTESEINQLLELWERYNKNER